MAHQSYWRELNAGVATASEAGAVADADAGSVTKPGHQTVTK